MSDNQRYAELHEALLERLGYTPADLDARVDEAASRFGFAPADLLAPNEALVGELTDILTVNHTEVFRHAPHFTELEEKLVQLRSLGRREVRVWSAGCATGEEPMSVAHVIRRLGMVATILATDVSEAALAVARGGRARQRSSASEWLEDPELRAMMRVEKHSIVEPLPAELGVTFDVIFCRNLLIYFAPERARRTLNRLATHVSYDGSLVLAPVEALLGNPIGFVPGQTLGWYDRETALPRESRPTPPRVEATPPAEAPVAPSPSASAVPAGSAPASLLSDILSIPDQEGAESRAREMVEEQPDNALAWFVLGEVLLRRNETAQARLCYQRTLHTVPQTEPASIRAMLISVAESRLHSELV